MAEDEKTFPGGFPADQPEEQFQEPYPETEATLPESDGNTEPTEAELPTEPTDLPSAEEAAANTGTDEVTSPESGADETPPSSLAEDPLRPPTPPSPGEASTPSPWVGDAFNLGFEDNAEELDLESDEWVHFSGPDCVVSLRRSLLPNTLPKTLSIRPRGEFGTG